jgi:hypothetical protein
MQDFECVILQYKMDIILLLSPLNFHAKMNSICVVFYVSRWLTLLFKVLGRGTCRRQPCLNLGVKETFMS